MKSTISWKEKRTFEAHTESGHTFVFGASSGEGDPAPGARPMELLLIGTAGCSAYDVVSILEKSRQDFETVDVEITGNRRDEVPQVFDAIHMHFTVKGTNVAEKYVKRAIDLSVEKYCSASRMMAETAEITHSFEIVQA